MNKNEEIEKTLNSLDGIERAVTNPLLYNKVVERLNRGEAIVVSIAPRIIWQAAAGFAALVALNVFVWTRAEGPAKTAQQHQSNPLTKEYFSYLNTDQF